MESRADDSHLRRAIELATANVRSGGGPFGALVVRDGVLIASGVNRVVADLDPTAHAEVVAIRAACRLAGAYSLTGGTLYTSCEPCPMCLAAALWARIDRVVYSATRYDAAAAGFDDARFYAELSAEPEHRTVPVVRLAVETSTQPFDAWVARDDRRPY